MLCGIVVFICAVCVILSKLNLIGTCLADVYSSIPNNSRLDIYAVYSFSLLFIVCYDRVALKRTYILSFRDWSFHNFSFSVHTFVLKIIVVVKV